MRLQAIICGTIKGLLHQGRMLNGYSKNAIKLSKKLRMSKINLFFDTIVYLYRCITKIFLCNYHELSFYINLSLRVVDELNKFILDIRSFRVKRELSLLSSHS